MDKGSIRDFRGTDRYEVRSCLGVGGMGVVYEAFDRKHDLPVALKVLRKFNPKNVLRFKSEFRSLTDILHPNLVRLGELHYDQGQWFFTMELIEGQDFLDYVWLGQDLINVPSQGEVIGRPRFNERRLRSAIGQLTLGVTALHAANKVHRDIKPSNILVTTDDRVVLLDFGLVIDRPAASLAAEAHPIGTARYMAPEQAASMPVSPETDWYAVGCVLYHALTGAPPFSGTRMEVLLAKQREEPPPPGHLVPTIPADLDSLCADLLRFDPRARPTGVEVLDRLGLEMELQATAWDVSAASTGSVGPPFIGRDHELGTLREAFGDSVQGRPITVFIHGESGIGKSTLVRRFIESLSEEMPGALVLSGRCYERESVPYKAFDGIVDALSRQISGMDAFQATVLLPADAALLGRLFPVLHQIPAMAHVAPPVHESANPQELRGRSFMALRQLLTNIARRQPLVLFIDDFQWADADSHTLFSDLMRPPDEPPLLLIVAMRRKSGAIDLAALFKSLGETRQISLQRLLPEETLALTHSLYNTLLGHSSSDGRIIERISQESGGQPLFIHELVRYLATTGAQTTGKIHLEEALLSRLDTLEDPARRFLEIVSLTGVPIPIAVAGRAASLEPVDTMRLVSLLKTANLIRSTGKRTVDAVEPYHDRVREAVLALLDDERRRQYHRALLEAGAAAAEPHLLVAHFKAAGEPELAARHAAAAARNAREALAFDRAAGLFRMALDLGCFTAQEIQELRLSLAEALVNAGRGADAAAVFLAVSRNTQDPVLRLECDGQAAEQLLVSGHVSEGLETVRRILSGMGTNLPKTPRRALVSLLWRRLRIRLRGLRWKERVESQVAREDLLRADVYNAVASGLALVDTVPGMDFQTRFLLAALRSGETSRVVRAIAQEASFLGSQGGRSLARARRLLDFCRGVAERSQDPFLVAWTVGVDGCLHYFEGRFHTGAALLDQAEHLFLNDVTHGSPRELSHVRLFHLWTVLYGSSFSQLSELFDSYMRDAERRGDRFAATSIRCSGNVVWLVRGQPEEARRDLEQADWVPPEGTLHLQHYWDLEARSQIALYEGRAAAALEELTPQFKAIGRSLIPRIQIVRCHIATLHARLALAAALSAKNPAPPLKLATRHGERVMREEASFAKVWALPLLAAVDLQRGKVEQGLGHLSRTIAFADTHDMPCYAAAARWRLGERLAGEAGRALINRATEWMTSEQIREPERFLEVLAPGFPPPA